MRLNISILLFIILLNFNYTTAQETTELDSLEKILLESNHDTVKVNTLIELTELTMSEPAKSVAYSEEALQLAKNIDFKNGKTRAYIQIGLYYTGQSEFDVSISYFDSAIVIAKTIKDLRLEIAALGNAGNSFCYKSNYNKGLEYYLSALAVMKELKDTVWIATANNNIGNIYSYLEDEKLALDYYLEALKLYERIKFSPGIALATGNIGNIYNAIGEHKKALKYFLSSLELNIKLKDKFKIAESYSNIATAYTGLKNNKKAIEFYLKARKLFKELGDKNSFSIVGTAIATHYINNKQYSKAQKYVIETIEISKKIDAKYTLMSCYRLQSRIDSSKGNFVMAFKNYKDFSDLKDSIFQESKSEQIAEMQTKFNTDAKEKENELLKSKEIQSNALLREKEAKNKVLNTLIYAALAAFIFVLAIAFLLLRISKQRKLANRQLEFKNAEIFQQKEEILVQTEFLEKANLDISIKNMDLEKFNTEIKASINYASRIQNAMLPNKSFIADIFPEHFIFYRPRDIVSGDFYWIKKIDNIVLCAVADCTGHGVPGAFLSMLGTAIMNEIATKKEIVTTSEMLEEMRHKIETSLNHNRDSHETKDGMDLALFALNTENMTMQFSGANSSLYVAHNDELIQYKGVLSPIGLSVKPKKFENLEVDIQKGDMVYMFSDGYPDQFHHKTERKLKIGRFREILKKIAPEPINEQHNILSKTFDNWKGDMRQIDDVLVMGIKI